QQKNLSNLPCSGQFRHYPLRQNIYQLILLKTYGNFRGKKRFRSFALGIMKMETLAQPSVKDKIATEAFTLFCRRGIKGTSVDDIAQHLSMSKKTIYKWFSNKDEIVFWAINSYLTSIDTDCERCKEEAPNAIEELFAIMKTTRQVFASIHPSIFYDLQKYHANAWQKWQEYKNHDFLNRIKENLERGMS